MDRTMTNQPSAEAVAAWIDGASIEEIMEFRETDYFIGKTPEQRTDGLPKWLVETGRIASNPATAQVAGEGDGD